MDVELPQTADTIAARTFSDDAAVVSEVGSAFIQGLQSTGVAATAKHFPGLGPATVNTDFAPTEVVARQETLDAALQPFQAAVDSGVELVMVASASYPAYGPENAKDPNRPASAVQAITDTLLRGQLGFKGVVITDDLQSIAIETLTTPAAAGVAALGAGCDLLLYASGAGGSEDAFAAVVKAVKQEKLSREQVQASYDRITDLKSRWLRQLDDFRRIGCRGRATNARETMKDLLAPDDTRDALRKMGGLLFGIGMLMVAMRKEADYSDFVLLLIYLIPAALPLRGGRLHRQVHRRGPALAGRLQRLRPDLRGAGAGPVRRMGRRAIRLEHVLDLRGDGRARLLCGRGEGHPVPAAGRLDRDDRRLERRSGTRSSSDGIARDFGIYRGLLGILSIILLAGALYLWRRSPDARVTGTVVNDGGDQGAWKASELVTGAGISAVLACSLGISSIATFAGPLGFARVHDRRDLRRVGRAAAADLARAGRARDA